MDTPKKMNDCYFYYYSTCIRGAWCAFRHEAAALGCESVCPAWQQGKCRDTACKLRHMELKKNRKTIPCYWESQPSGCQKQHCAFLHRFAKPAAISNSSAETSGSSSAVKTTAMANDSNAQEHTSPDTNVISNTTSAVNVTSAPVIVSAAVPLTAQPTQQVLAALPPNVRPVVIDASELTLLSGPQAGDIMASRRVIPHAQMANLPMAPHAQIVTNPQPNAAYLPIDPLVINFEEGMRLY